MEFIISDVVTFNKLYAKDNHKFIPLRGIEELDGFPKIGIRIHEFDVLTEEQEALQKQVEALAFFGVVHLTYVDEEGNENTHYNKATNLVVKHTAYVAPVMQDTVITEEYIQSVLDSEEGGCAGGACTI